LKSVPNARQKFKVFEGEWAVAQHDGHTTKGIQDAVEYHLVTSAQALDLICSRLGAFAPKLAPNNKRS
jgi:hypothetical protein